MEAVIDHRIEPEVAVPAPRRTHLPWRSSLLLTVAVLLIGIFVLGSGQALWEGAKLAWLSGLGRTVTAQIVEIRWEPTAQKIPKGPPPRQTAVRYAVTVPGPNGPITQSGWISLSEPSPLPSAESGAESVPGKALTAPAYHISQAIPLRYAHWMGMTWSQPWGPNPGSRIVTLFLAGGLVLAVSLRLLRRLVRWRQARLSLLRQGTATVGTITHTRSEAEDTVRYFLRYGYPIGNGEGREHEEQVSADQWRLFHVGQPVTVLYDPEQPERAGLYALMGTHL